MKSKIHNLSITPSLIGECMAELRDIELQKSRLLFRKNLERLGQMMAFELSKSLNYVNKSVQTPLGVAECQVLKDQPIVATILRAGLPMHAGFLDFFDKADNCFASAYRKHNKDGSFSIELGYHAHPSLQDRTLILIDPMLATGKSMVEVYKLLTRTEKPCQVHVVSAVASQEGLDYISRTMPEAEIWVASIDQRLDSHFYIIPGLGDAGDLAFGEKEQG
ncbi:MAG: uracil phosphoribosyltransferase [bacterium]|nr:uracil phosphoribosyltransferase [bacterium]